MAAEVSVASIFYARFHDAYGPKVLHQVPEGSVIPCPPSPTALKEPYFDFQSISSYLIPNREFCNRPLSICSNGFRILGHPVCITDPAKYERNDFIFNFCIVLNEGADFTPFKGVVAKLARLFANLEEQNGFLSREEEDDTILAAGTEGYGGEKGSKVFAVVEMVFEDLISVGETMIPIDESNTLNLSLCPTKPTPPPVCSYHVPLSVVRFDSLQTSAWDLTVQRILPHIDGINSVARIAQLADTDTRLTRRAIRHLVYYDCVLLLDIFSFSAIYAPTPEIVDFIASTDMQDECRQYVYSPGSPFGRSADELQIVENNRKSATTNRLGQAQQEVRAPSGLSNHSKKYSQTSQGDASAMTSSLDPDLPSRIQLITLYTSLRQGLPLRDYCLNRSRDLRNIDVRRLITFGVIKGFLYRVHKYALRTTGSQVAAEDLLASAGNGKADGTGVKPLAQGTSKAAKSGPEAVRRPRKRNEDEDEEASWRVAALSSGWRLPNAPPSSILSERIKRTENGKGAVGQEGKEESKRKGTASVGTAGAESGATSAAKRRADRDLLRFADGGKCFDEVCTELRITEREAIDRVREAAGGEVVIVCK